MKLAYFRLFSLSLGLSLPLMTNAQCSYSTDIGTFAGSHVKGYTGDGGAGTAATMGSPYAVASDASGNVYIADYFNHAVRKVNSSTGTITTIAGTGTAGYNGDGIAATAAQLNGPAGLYIDASGNLYIADKFNERIRKVDASTGEISSIAGNGLHGAWNTPAFGNGGPATAAALTYPTAITADCSGNMFIADNGSQTVRKIDASGIITRFAGTHVGSFNGDGIAATSAHLNHPLSLTADCDGNVYIADSWNNRIRKVDTLGVISTVAGNGEGAYYGDGGSATSASIWIPWGVTLDGCGNLFICDYNNNAVRVVNTSGTISTFAGMNKRGYNGDGGAATAAKIYLPSGLTIDGSNNVYMADYGNLVIRYMGTLGYGSRAYVNGTTQDLSVHVNDGPVAINTLMAVPSVPAGATTTWTVSAMPVHGTLSGFSATTVSTGGVVMPNGLTYQPEPGYAGTDEFTVVMSDGTSQASTTVNVKVDGIATSVSGLTATPKAGAAIMPNPSNGTFKCEFTSEKNCDLELAVADLTGRVIYTQNIHAVAGSNIADVELPATIHHQSLVIVSLGNAEVRYPIIKVSITE